MKRLALLILMCLVIDIPFQVSAQGYRYNNSRYYQNQLYRRTTNSSARQLSGDQKTSERNMPEKKSSKDKNKRKTTEKKDKKKTEGNYSVGEGEIELVVAGEGSGLKEATQNALRSAIEQAYGVFVSSNTTLLDDELVKDEIATISSGNIKAYKELGSMVLPNGNTTVTLSTIVTISKLVSYAQSHGSAAEFAGQTFMMNMKMRELNKENERKVLDNACDELKEIAFILYDYSISLGEPRFRTGWGLYDLPVCIEVCPNENFKSWMEKFSSTLSAISLSESECAEWEKNGMKTYTFSFFGKTVHLRNGYGYNRSEGNGRETLREMIDVFNIFKIGWRIIVNNGDITFSPIERWVIDYYYLIKNGNEKELAAYRNAAKNGVFP